MITTFRFSSSGLAEEAYSDLLDAKYVASHLDDQPLIRVMHEADDLDALQQFAEMLDEDVVTDSAHER